MGTITNIDAVRLTPEGVSSFLSLLALLVHNMSLESQHPLTRRFQDLLRTWKTAQREHVQSVVGGLTQEDEKCLLALCRDLGFALEHIPSEDF